MKRLILIVGISGLLSGCGSTYVPRPNYVKLVSTNEPVRYNYQSPIFRYSPVIVRKVECSGLEENTDDGCEGGNCKIPNR